MVLVWLGTTAYCVAKVLAFFLPTISFAPLLSGRGTWSSIIMKIVLTLKTTWKCLKLPGPLDNTLRNRWILGFMEFSSPPPPPVSGRILRLAILAHFFGLQFFLIIFFFSWGGGADRVAKNSWLFYRGWIYFYIFLYYQYRKFDLIVLSIPIRLLVFPQMLDFFVVVVQVSCYGPDYTILVI